MPDVRTWAGIRADAGRTTGTGDPFRTPGGLAPRIQSTSRFWIA